MKYTDWIIVHPYAYDHYAEGDQYDKWMVSVFNECVDDRLPLPEEVCEWWLDILDSLQFDPKDLSRPMSDYWSWRKKWGLRNWHVNDWNAHGGTWYWQHHPEESPYLTRDKEAMDKWRKHADKRVGSVTLPAVEPTTASHGVVSFVKKFSGVSSVTLTAPGPITSVQVTYEKSE